MKIIVGVAVYEDLDRVNLFVDSILHVVNPRDLKLLFVNTGTPYQEMTDKILSLSEYGFDVNLIESEPKARVYAEVMKEKVLAAVDICGPDDLYYNSDDDYTFNPWVFKVIKKVFEENKNVEYLSPIWCGATRVSEVLELSGFTFFKTGSSLGGAFCARSKNFFKDALSYLTRRNVDPMFDRGFWKYITEINKYDKNFIYAMGGFSLVQHNNLISNFLSMKKDVYDHMYGIDYIENKPVQLGDMNE